MMGLSSPQQVLMLTIIAIVLNIQNTSSSTVLNKCCPVNQHFDAINFTCVDKRLGGGSKWHPPVENSTSAIASSVTPVYGAKPSCGRHYMSDLWHDLKKNLDDFRLHFEMGKIVLEVLSKSSRHDLKVAHEVKFASENFCVDSTEIPKDTTDDADVTATGGNTLLASRIDTTPSESFLVLLCPCKTLKCVRKCCHDRQVITKDGTCVEAIRANKRGRWTPKLGVDPKGNYSYYRLVDHFPSDDEGCVTGLHSIPRSNSSNQSNIMLGELGEIQYNLDGRDVVVEPDSYCVDNAEFNGGSNQEFVFFCIIADTTAAFYEVLYGVLLVLGAFALFVTVALTIALPDMRKNIHGKMGLCHNCALLVAFITNSIIQLSGSSLSQSFCVWLSFILQSTMLCAFFWLNSMCLEISWVFKSLRPVQNITPEGSRKKFNYYALYSFGGTCLIFFVTLIVEFGPVADNNPYKPSFGIAKCFFNHRPAQALFLYGPMAVLLLFNIILFVFTAVNILLVRRQASVLNTGDSQFTRKNDDLVLYAKLFTLMGASWIFEVISWAVEGPKAHWVFTDVINLLRGVFIFIIFCCKKTVYRDLRPKLHDWFGIPLSMAGHSNTNSDGTARSGLTAGSELARSTDNIIGATPIPLQPLQLQ